MTAVLVAADPGQPYVSPDDLGGIPGLWAQAVQEQIRPVIAEIYLTTENTVHTQMIDTVGVDLPNPGSLAGETYLAGAVNTMTDVIGDDLWETARTQLLEGFQSGESIDELAARLRGSADLTARKATLLARTMVLDASNAASIATARVAGIPMRKGWLDTPDARTRETHRLAGAAYGPDELMIDLEAKFVVGGFECDRPHDPLLPAEESANCRCTLAYSISDDDAAQARDRYTQPALPNTSGQAPIRRAQARQADIDRARGFGELFAEVEELAGNEVETPVIAARLRALAGRRGIPDQIRDSLIDAAGDVDRLRRLAARVAEEADITPIGRAGHIVLFDAAIHRSAERVAPGDPVEIFRPGGYYTRAGQRILLFKALVEPVGHTSPGLWGGHTSGPGAAIAALVAHLPGKHDQSSHGRGGKTGQAALDAVPAKLTPAPQGHFGNYEGASLDAPEGAGSARALAEYEGAEFHTTNTSLRGGFRREENPDEFTLEREAAVAARVADMDKTMAVSRLSEDIVVERGVTKGNAVFGREVWHGDVVDWNDFEHGTDRWDAGERPDLTGLRFRDKAFTSTTANPVVADAFVGPALRFQQQTGHVGLEGEPVVMRISVPKGTGAVALGGMGTVGPRGPTDSAEILLERGLSFEVTADRGVQDGIRRLDVMVVPGG